MSIVTSHDNRDILSRYDVIQSRLVKMVCHDEIILQGCSGVVCFCYDQIPFTALQPFAESLTAEIYHYIGCIMGISCGFCYFLAKYEFQINLFKNILRLCLFRDDQIYSGVF